MISQVITDLDITGDDIDEFKQLINPPCPQIENRWIFFGETSNGQHTNYSEQQNIPRFG